MTSSKRIENSTQATSWRAATTVTPSANVISWATIWALSPPKTLIISPFPVVSVKVSEKRSTPISSPTPICPGGVAMPIRSIASPRPMPVSPNESPVPMNRLRGTSVITKSNRGRPVREALVAPVGRFATSAGVPVNSAFGGANGSPVPTGTRAMSNAPAAIAASGSGVAAASPTVPTKGGALPAAMTAASSARTSKAAAVEFSRSPGSEQTTVPLEAAKSVPSKPAVSLTSPQTCMCETKTP